MPWSAYLAPCGASGRGGAPGRARTFALPTGDLRVARILRHKQIADKCARQAFATGTRPPPPFRVSGARSPGEGARGARSHSRKGSSAGGPGGAALPFGEKFLRICQTAASRPRNPRRESFSAAKTVEAHSAAMTEAGSAASVSQDEKSREDSVSVVVVVVVVREPSPV